MLKHGFLGSETAPAALLRLRLHLWHSFWKSLLPGDFVSSPKSAIEAILYAKIGRQDALAFPDLIPGSIVRVNPRFSNGCIPKTNGATSTQIFLIEHNKGLFCCRLRVVEKGIIVPIGTSLSYAQVELKVPREARIVGVVDLEIRPMLQTEQPEVPKDLAKHWKPRPLVTDKKFGQLLRASRTKLRLSLREVAGMSRNIARSAWGRKIFCFSQFSLRLRAFQRATASLTQGDYSLLALRSAIPRVSEGDWNCLGRSRHGADTRPSRSQSARHGVRRKLGRQRHARSERIP